MTVTAMAEDKPLRTVSLRRRVAVWTLLLLVIVLTTLGLVVNWLLGDALRSDLRQRLEDKASYAAVLREQGVTGQTLADRLAGGGRLILYTGSAIIGGADPLREALASALAVRGCSLRYREIDPDVFGEELDGPAYAEVDRIALVAAIATRGGG